MEAHVCNHPKVSHTVVYSLGDLRGADGKVEQEFKDLESADLFAQKIIRQDVGRVQWVRIFRSDNRSYVCFSWTNPKNESSLVNTEKVKLEVDMNPLKEAFDNVATGFKEQGQSIRLLWSAQMITGVAVIVLIVEKIASHF